jgi:hypothetical protein
MRALVACAVSIFCALGFSTIAMAKQLPQKLTVIVDMPALDAAKVTSYLKAEVDRLFLFRDIQFSWLAKSDVQLGSTWEDVVVVKFRGDCRITAAPEPAGDERGPYAWTHVTDGEVLPFSEISCDRVRKNVKSVMHGGLYAEADLLMGRALGRVLAHELVHILTGNCDHDAKGVFRHAFRPDELIADRMHLYRMTPAKRSKPAPVDVSSVTRSTVKREPIGQLP